MPTSSQSPIHERKPSDLNSDNHDFSVSSKRKSSASTQSPNGKEEPETNGKKKRRKVNHACVYCRRSHMTCDLERPCTRCVKRDIGHLCHDEPRDGQRRSESETGVADIAPAMEGVESAGKQDMAVTGAGNLNGGMGGYAARESIADTSSMVDVGGQPQIAHPTPVSPVQLQRPSTSGNSMMGAMMPPNFDWNNNGVHNQFQDMHHLYPNNMFNTSEVTNEYNLLNDFLSSSLLDDGALYSDDNTNVLFSDPLLSTNSVNATLNPTFNPQQQMQQLQQQPFQIPPQPSLQPQSNRTAGEEISRPPSTHPSAEAIRTKFYLTAADPAGTASAEDRLHKLLKAKYDAGMLKPFNYVKGYARLNTYMSRHLKRDSQVRILKQLDRFRPKFCSAAEKLTDMQLVLVEMWFERSLMEYDRVFASMAIPACCWRRTGEIFRGNREMAELVGVGWEELRDGRLALHEILAEEGLVSYWEKFGAIAFDASQKAILTSCALKCPARREGVEGVAAGRVGRRRLR